MEPTLPDQIEVLKYGNAVLLALFLANLTQIALLTFLCVRRR